MGYDPVPVEGPDGTIHHSIYACAQAEGVCTSTVWSHLERNGHLKNLGKGPAKGLVPKNAVEVEYFGKKFPSRSEAARFFGYTEGALKHVQRGRKMSKAMEANMRAKLKAIGHKIVEPSTSVALVPAKSVIEQMKEDAERSNKLMKRLYG